MAGRCTPRRGGLVADALEVGKLIELNERMTERLLEGVSVSGLPDWDQGRSQRVRFIDFDHPERNDFLAINQFRVDEPGGQAKKFVAPDVVLFVNGIPLVVIECKSPYIIDPMAEGINQLRRYANQRALGMPEGNEQLFWTNQFVVSTYGDKARVGTFTAEPEHFLEWKDAAPLSRDELAAQLGKPAAELTGQELLVAGHATPVQPARHRPALHPVHRSRTAGDQDRRPLPAVPRGRPSAAAAADWQDPRRGWRAATGAAASSGTPRARASRSRWCSWCARCVRIRCSGPSRSSSSPTAPTWRSSCPRPPSFPARRAARSAHQQAQEILTEKGPALVFAMIQKYRDTDTAGAARRAWLATTPTRRSASSTPTRRS